MEPFLGSGPVNALGTRCPWQARGPEPNTRSKGQEGRRRKGLPSSEGLRVPNPVRQAVTDLDAVEDAVAALVQVAEQVEDLFLEQVVRAGCHGRGDRLHPEPKGADQPGGRL